MNGMSKKDELQKIKNAVYGNTLLKKQSEFLVSQYLDMIQGALFSDCDVPNFKTVEADFKALSKDEKIALLRNYHY